MIKDARSKLVDMLLVDQGLLSDLKLSFLPMRLKNTGKVFYDYICFIVNMSIGHYYN